MMNQNNKVEFFTTNNANSQDALANIPRIIQLDTILNRSRFIWAREQSQQASNNN